MGIEPGRQVSSGEAVSERVVVLPLGASPPIGAEDADIPTINEAEDYGTNTGGDRTERRQCRSAGEPRQQRPKQPGQSQRRLPVFAGEDTLNLDKSRAAKLRTGGAVGPSSLNLPPPSQHPLSPPTPGRAVRLEELEAQVGRMGKL